MCLPKEYQEKSGIIKIPRSSSEREYLARNGLIGKIRLSSDMTDRDIRNEIISVFANSGLSEFKFLQSTGGRSKQLMIPSVARGFKWTASTVSAINAKMPIYISVEGMSDQGVTERSKAEAIFNTVR